jgi:hypothetical protein
MGIEEDGGQTRGTEEEDRGRGTMTRAISMLEIQGYNTDDGVFGLIAIPTFIFLFLICFIRFSISSSDESASI